MSIASYYRVLLLSGCVIFAIRFSIFSITQKEPEKRECIPSEGSRDKHQTSGEAKNCSNGQTFEVRLPDAILIGNRKAGTHAIVRFLKLLNPFIRYPPKGEVHYFDRNSSYLKGLDYYKSLMPLACQGDIIIEKTPDYFLRPYVPQRVHDWNKDIKLLLSLRDPIDRALSDYNELKRLMYASIIPIRKEYLQNSFEYLSLNDDGSVNEHFHSLRSSLSDLNMQNWLEYFPLERIHIIDADVLTYENPAKELAKIEAFLEFVPNITEEDFIYNSTKGFYCIRGRHCLPKGERYPEINTIVHSRLVRYFRPHVISLKKLIGQQLSWMDKYLNTSLPITYPKSPK